MSGGEEEGSGGSGGVGSVSPSVPSSLLTWFPSGGELSRLAVSEVRSLFRSPESLLRLDVHRAEFAAKREEARQLLKPSHRSAGGGHQAGSAAATTGSQTLSGQRIAEG